MVLRTWLHRIIFIPKIYYRSLFARPQKCLRRRRSFLSYSIVTSAKAIQMKMWTYVWMGIWCWRALAHSYLLTNHDRIVFFFSSTVNQPWMLLRVDRLKWVRYWIHISNKRWQFMKCIYGFMGFLCVRSAIHPSHMCMQFRRNTPAALSPIDRFQYLFEFGSISFEAEVNMPAVNVFLTAYTSEMSIGNNATFVFPPFPQ